jgi:hypothetical protein
VAATSPTGRGAPHLRIVEGAKPGFRLAVDADAIGAGTRIAKRMRVQLAADLEAAVEALAERVQAADHRRSLERVRRAARLQRELDSYSPDADRKLLEQRDDLMAALALRPEAVELLPHIEALVALLERDDDTLRSTEQDLAAATGALEFLPPTTAAQPEPAAIIRAYGDAAAADEARFRAEQAHVAAVRLHQEIVGATTDARASDIEVEKAARAMATSRGRERRLVLVATAFAAGAVLMAGLTVVAVLPTAIGLALALACLPPAAEQVRRRVAARNIAEKRWVAAGARSLLAEQGRLSDEQGVRARRVDTAAALVEAERLAAEADRRWRYLVGPDAPDDLESILGPLETHLERRDARDRAAAVRGTRAATLAATLEETGIVPGPDVMATVDRLRRLLDLRPRAREFLFEVSDVEQREVERMLLSSMLAGGTITELRARVKAEPRGNDRGLVVIDDGDERTRKRVSTELGWLDGRAKVVVVTATPELWSSDDAEPAAPTPPPAEAPPTEAESPGSTTDSGPDQPWFVTR